MRELKDIIENQIINRLSKSFSKSPNQLNKVHESDAEIIELDNSSYNLAVTIDTISEEIKTGLYSDPYLIGWMSVMVNLSDLAAVGASPIGIVIAQILPQNLSNDFIEKLQKGINDACSKCGTFILGGDTNFGDELIITGCAIGTVEKNNFITRMGIKPGDKIYSTREFGVGNAYAAEKLILLSQQTDSVLYEKDTLKYFPSAKLEWKNLLIKYATSCTDTSDGLISSLDQLMRLNNVGFRINNDLENIINDASKDLFNKLNIPLWLLLAGEHGEFELLFSIPSEKENEFLNEASLLNLNPIPVAESIDETVIKINIYDKVQSVDSKKIRNLAFEKDFSPNKYLQKLLEIDEELKK